MAFRTHPGLKSKCYVSRLMNTLQLRREAKYLCEWSKVSVQVLVSPHCKMRPLRQRHEAICPRVTEGSGLGSGTDPTARVPEDRAIVPFINSHLVRKHHGQLDPSFELCSFYLKKLF